MKFFERDDWKYFRYKLEDKWERSGIKDLISQHPMVIAGIMGACILLFLSIAVGQLLPDKPVSAVEPQEVWFYDLNSKELFAAKGSKLPPIKAPSGPLPDGGKAGVRAYVFSSENADGTESRICFLEKLSPEGKKMQKNYEPEKHNAKEWAMGRFFKRPEDKEWVGADSPEGRAIYEERFKGVSGEEFPVRGENR